MKKMGLKNLPRNIQITTSLAHINVHVSFMLFHCFLLLDLNLINEPTSTEANFQIMLQNYGLQVLIPIQILIIRMSPSPHPIPHTRACRQMKRTCVRH